MVKNKDCIYEKVLMTVVLLVLLIIFGYAIVSKLRYGCFSLQEKKITIPELSEIPCYKLKGYSEQKADYPMNIIYEYSCKGKVVSKNNFSSDYYSYDIRDEYLRRCLHE
jgi:hypothetical protein